MFLYITKRKLARAVKAAVEAELIPATPYRLVTVGDHVYLLWEDTSMTARVFRRDDSTIQIMRAAPHCEGSPFETWIQPWEGPTR